MSSLVGNIRPRHLVLICLIICHQPAASKAETATAENNLIEDVETGGGSADLAETPPKWTKPAKMEQEIYSFAAHERVNMMYSFLLP